MSYTSLGFLAFTALCCIVYFLVEQKYRWIVLLAASTVFYAVNSKWLSIYLLLAALVVYLCGLAIGKRNELYSTVKQTLEKEERKTFKKKNDRIKRLFVFAGIFSLALMLLSLKYFGFFTEIIAKLVSLSGGNFNIGIIKFALPLGISYYTLSGISYLVDIYRGAVSPEKNPAKLLLFLSFFPQIVEGPIPRYAELSESLFAGAAFNYKRLISALIRIIWGLIKKLVLADRAAILVNNIFGTDSSSSGAALMLAVILYTFQIYADFSGCMDIVCGIAEIFGIKLSENFNRPFFSKSVDEFWRRWHITLGSWLKDYVFYPISLSAWNKKLGQSCRKKLGSYYGSLVPASAALFFVWFLIGFWHGSGWKYIFYGLYYFTIMMFGKYLKPVSDKTLSLLKINRDSKPYCIFEMLRTDFLVCVGMLIFRAETVSQAFSMFIRSFTSFLTPASSLSAVITCDGFGMSDFILVVIGAAVVFAVGIAAEKGIELRIEIMKSPLYFCPVLFIMPLLLVIFGKYGADGSGSAFLYGQF